MDLGLKDRVALVTASSKGLGRAVAWTLAREGAKLVLCSRDKEALEKTADEIFLSTGVSVFPLSVDLSEADQIDWLMEETHDLFGRVDVLVTNAGGPRPGGFEEMEEGRLGQGRAAHPHERGAALPGRDSRHEAPGVGPHHQPRLGLGQAALGKLVAFQRPATRRGGVDQVPVPRTGAPIIFWSMPSVRGLSRLIASFSFWRPRPSKAGAPSRS